MEVPGVDILLGNGRAPLRWLCPSGKWGSIKTGHLIPVEGTKQFLEGLRGFFLFMLTFWIDRYNGVIIKAGFMNMKTRTKELFNE